MWEWAVGHSAHEMRPSTPQAVQPPRAARTAVCGKIELCSLPVESLPGRAEVVTQARLAGASSVASLAGCHALVHGLAAIGAGTGMKMAHPVELAAAAEGSHTEHREPGRAPPVVAAIDELRSRMAPMPEARLPQVRAAKPVASKELEYSWLQRSKLGLKEVVVTSPSANAARYSPASQPVRARGARAVMEVAKGTLSVGSAGTAQAKENVESRHL
mmetsp:Transcript_3617/g.8401  ORF Transcript_3617/g.8401 Transcript_3617/m.8401 type:complete len:216 (-) Transcript_3617:1441-2088(-)